MAKSNHRKRSAKPKNSLAGNLLLELIAAVAFLMLLSVSSDGRVSELSTEKTMDRSVNYGSMVSGYVSDQFQRNRLFANR